MTPSSPSWKALILAAGYGTRLLPYTRHTPKPLFTINNVPVLDTIISRLAAAGCGGVIINTHHLSEKIARHCGSRRYGIPVSLSYEPEILGTGGAMKNNAGFFGDRPFMAINGDIVTDIDLEAAYRFHADHGHDVTLVLHDCEKFNSIAVDSDNRVAQVYRAGGEKPSGTRLLAFTGIHVLHPRVLDSLPAAGVYADIIDMYQAMLRRGQTITACVVKGHVWQDIGTPETYQAAAFEEMTRQALQQAFGNAAITAVHPIASDGSDTRWFRIISPRGSLIACDRGPAASEEVSEADAFALINRYLSARGVAVPKLYLSDPLAGLAFLEDLGDVSLQSVARSTADPDEIMRLYRLVIDQLLKLAVTGAEGFDDSWTYQTPSYDRRLILERECCYFANEFLQDYLGLDTRSLALEPEFQRLADLTLTFAVPGLMHRDMQSRNIMIKNDRPYFIDFQGARRGPVQYDLASLLIDPYAGLPPDLQNRLLGYYESGLSRRLTVDRELFRKGYACCAVTRNLQILGAFGFLTRKKGKTQFEPHIPEALSRLRHNLSTLELATGETFPRLTAAAEAGKLVTGHRNGRKSLTGG